MFAQPSAEHEFLSALTGQWTMEHRCSTGADQPPSVTHGRMTARSLGGLWVLIDCEGESPEGGSWTSQFTLGYDPVKKCYLGTFVASMMTHLWIYEGQRDEAGRLVMNVEGPRFDGKGTALYQDVFHIVDKDNWVLLSLLRNDDGSWTQFMEGHHQRMADT